jgi:branched-chain amino acid transport system substrate-binding protein
VDRGYKGTIFHSGASVNADFLRVGGKALEGSYNLALSFVVADQMPEGFPGRKESQEFVKLYESKYGPASQFAALAWNSVKIIEAAIPKALKTAKPGTEKFREALRDAIEQTKGLKAAGAVINMSPTDHTGISRDSMTVIRVENGKWKLEDHSSH